MTERKQDSRASLRWLGGAATAGAAAAAGGCCCHRGAQADGPGGAAPARAPVSEPDGYQLTEHVKQYYASARV